MERRGSYKKRKGINFGPKGKHSYKSNTSIFAGSTMHGEVDCIVIDLSWDIIYSNFDSDN